jgi:hypothetical protein
VKEHFFVVRIWREYREIEGQPPRFRGMIQHAVTGEKQYFNDISSIAAFLATHLHLADVSEEESQYQLKFWEEELQQSPLFLPQDVGKEDGSL